MQVMSKCDCHKTLEGLQNCKLRCWKKGQIAQGHCGQRDLFFIPALSQQSVHLSIYPFVFLYVFFLSIDLSIDLFCPYTYFIQPIVLFYLICLIYLSNLSDLSIFISSFRLFVFLSLYLSTYLSMHLSIVTIDLPTYQPFNQSIYVSIYLSIYASTDPATLSI